MKIVYGLLLSVFAAAPALADNAEAMDKWFRDGYAALYVEESWNRADEFAQYFADSIEYRSDEGIVKADVNGFVIDSLEVWRDEGWLGTDVESLDTKMLNSTTVVFDVVWKDRNNDGSTSFECGWYVADKIDGVWLLSQYIATTCTE